MGNSLIAWCHGFQAVYKFADKYGNEVALREWHYICSGAVGGVKNHFTNLCVAPVDNNCSPLANRQILTCVIHMLQHVSTIRPPFTLWDLFILLTGEVNKLYMSYIVNT